jgi:hypothetical protein
VGFDWLLYAYPALMAFVTGGDPYTAVPNFVTPPWMLALLSPLALLPPEYGLYAVDGIAVAGLVALCIRHNRWWLALPLAVSFPMMTLLYHGQVDGISLWGLVVGGPVGLVLLAAKPQVAAFVGLIWLIKAWREGKWLAALRLVWPTLIVIGASAWLYPNWVRGMMAASQWAHTTNGFPWSIALGAAVLVAAIRQQREDLAALATVLLAPYANVQSWMAALALLTFRYPAEGVTAALASWLIPTWLLWRG